MPKPTVEEVTAFMQANEYFFTSFLPEYKSFVEEGRLVSIPFISNKANEVEALYKSAGKMDNLQDYSTKLIRLLSRYRETVPPPPLLKEEQPDMESLSPGHSALDRAVVEESRANRNPRINRLFPEDEIKPMAKSKPQLVEQRPVIWYWNRGNFGPALQHEKIREFIMANENHPAVLFGRVLAQQEKEKQDQKAKEKQLEYWHFDDAYMALENYMYDEDRSPAMLALVVNLEKCITNFTKGLSSNLDFVKHCKVACAKYKEDVIHPKSTVITKIAWLTIALNSIESKTTPALLPVKTTDTSIQMKEALSSSAASEAPTGTERVEIPGGPAELADSKSSPPPLSATESLLSAFKPVFVELNSTSGRETVPLMMDIQGFQDKFSEGKITGVQFVANCRVAIESYYTKFSANEEVVETLETLASALRSMETDIIADRLESATSSQNVTKQIKEALVSEKKKSATEQENEDPSSTSTL